MDAIFDGFAAKYDEEFTHTPVGKYQRQQVYACLEPLLTDRPLRILELNCGTGEDALWLAQQGHTVVATDISEAMVAEAQRKLAFHGVSERAQALALGIEDIQPEQFDAPFDLIFSNFGGWNCLNQAQIAAAAQKLTACLSPTGKVAAVIMPDRCLWELAYFTLRSRFAEARRRWIGHSRFADKQGKEHPIYYFSPRNFAGLWGEGWQTSKIQPIGLWVPPSYLNHHFENRPRLLSWLHQRDLKANRAARWADHAWVQIERKRHKQ